eukprot:966050-Pelagomonas_calceolata.AAC.3
MLSNYLLRLEQSAAWGALTQHQPCTVDCAFKLLILAGTARGLGRNLAPSTNLAICNLRFFTAYLTGTQGLGRNFAASIDLALNAGPRAQSCSQHRPRTEHTAWGAISQPAAGRAVQEAEQGAGDAGGCAAGWPGPRGVWGCARHMGVHRRLAHHIGVQWVQLVCNWCAQEACSSHRCAMGVHSNTSMYSHTWETGGGLRGVRSVLVCPVRQGCKEMPGLSLTLFSKTAYQTWARLIPNEFWFAQTAVVLYPQGPENEMQRSWTRPMLCDVADSTWLWEWDAGVMDQAIAMHNTTIRELLEEQGGHEIRNEGDSFVMSFHDASDAVRFCLQLCCELPRCQEGCQALPTGARCELLSLSWSSFVVSFHDASKLSALSEGGKPCRELLGLCGLEDVPGELMKACKLAACF